MLSRRGYAHYPGLRCLDLHTPLHGYKGKLTVRDLTDDLTAIIKFGRKPRSASTLSIRDIFETQSGSGI